MNGILAGNADKKLGLDDFHQGFLAITPGIWQFAMEYHPWKWMIYTKHDYLPWLC
jgi:hypothetical protein